MFDSRHYVPILRWKAAEQEALEKLTTAEKALITPVIELLMPQPTVFKIGDRQKTPAELLEESKKMLQESIPQVATKIMKYWGSSPLFIEMGLVDISLRATSLREILPSTKALGGRLIPITRLSADQTLQAANIQAAKANGEGMCLRLFRSDFTEAEEMKNKIQQFLQKSGFSEAEIDLLVDYQITDAECSKLKELSELIPSLSKWRSFTFASGSFPSDLTGYHPGLHQIPRLEWIGWKKQVDLGNLQRAPSFGDYTIQHPIHKEAARGANPSASIRYALPDEWIIMRGQGLRSAKSAGHAQYPAQAQLLSQHEKFLGANFSFGDAYIEQVGRDVNNKNTGNPRTWLRAGINHHLACTVNQISN